MVSALGTFLPLSLLAALLVFSPLIEGGTTHLANFVIRLLILVFTLSVLWFLPFFSPPFSLIGPVVMFLALAAWSTITSPYPNQSLQWLITLVCYGVLAFSVMGLWSSNGDGPGVAFKSMKLTLGLCVGMGIFESALALSQYAVLGEARPAGTFFNPNFLAAYLAPLLGLSLALFLGSWSQSPSPQSSPQRGEGSQGEGTSWVSLHAFTPLPQHGGEGRVRGRLAGMVWIGFIGLLLTGLALTGSRGGMLATFTGASVVLACWFGRKALGIVVTLVMVFLLVPNPLRDRLWLEHEANPVAYARMDMWTSGVHMLVDHPFGVGLGIYKYLAPQYAFPVEAQIARYAKVPHTAHNEWLQFGVELGVPALVVMGWAAIGLAKIGLDTLRRSTQADGRCLVVGLLGGLAALLVHAAVDSVFHAPAVVILLVILVAALVRSSPSYQTSQDGTPSPPPLPHNFNPLPHSGEEDLGEGAFPHGQTVSLSVGSRIVWGILGTSTILVVMFFATRLGLGWLTYQEGRDALQARHYPQAVDHFQQAARLDPTNATYANALGAAHYRWAQESAGKARHEKLDASIGHLQRAVQLNPVDGTLYGFLGWVSMNVAHQRAGNGAFDTRSNPWVGRAVRAYQQAIRQQPYNVFHYFQLARLFEATDRREKAEETIRQAIRLEPNFLPGRALLVRVALEEGEFEWARAEYEKIRSRYERYKHWSKTSIEADFLTVDWAALRAALAGTPLADLRAGLQG